MVARVHLIPHTGEINSNGVFTGPIDWPMVRTSSEPVVQVLSESRWGVHAINRRDNQQNGREWQIFPWLTMATKIDHTWQYFLTMLYNNTTDKYILREWVRGECTGRHGFFFIRKHRTSSHPSVDFSIFIVSSNMQHIVWGIFCRLEEHAFVLYRDYIGAWEVGHYLTGVTHQRGRRRVTANHVKNLAFCLEEKIVCY